jgi:hypothetical protein
VPRFLLPEDTALPTSSLKLGFIGLGTMGTPMLGHLMAAGH